MSEDTTRSELPEPPAMPAYPPPPPAPQRRAGRRRPRRALLSLGVAAALLVAGGVGAGVADLTEQPAAVSATSTSLTSTTSTTGAVYNPTATLGDSNSVQLGQRVIALGYALDLNGGPTVTSGIVSSLDRTIQVQDPNAAAGGRTYRDVFQTDAAINPGNSGGPLINLAGQVVGIDSAGTQQAQNIGFAIQIDAARSIIAKATA